MIKQASDRREHLIRKSNEKRSTCTRGPDKDRHYDPDLPNNSENYLFSWLKRQFILKDIQADTIEPPLPFQPRYELWKIEFERFDIKPDTILVGHSCGGGFLLRYLS